MTETQATSFRRFGYLSIQSDLVEGVPNLCAKFTLTSHAVSEVMAGHEHLCPVGLSQPASLNLTELDVNKVMFQTLEQGDGKGLAGFGGRQSTPSVSHIPGRAYRELASFGTTPRAPGSGV